MSKQTELEHMIQLYRQNQLPDDVKLVYVPIQKTAYGDYQIVGEYMATKETPSATNAPIKLFNTETIRLECFEIGPVVIFAGYGPQTTTLVIGRLRLEGYTVEPPD